MKLDPADIEKVARLAKSRGGKVLGTAPPDAEAPDIAPAQYSDSECCAPGLAAGRHEFTIPGFRPATINELTKKGNHFSASRLKKRDRLAVALHSRHVPKAIRRRRVSVEVTLAGRMRVVDPDALHKSTLDALVAAGLLVDDSPAWVEIGPMVQIRGAAKATRIILDDLDDTDGGTP